LLDGLYLEKEGVPSAMISTDAFNQQCKAMSSAHNFENYPFIEVFHPIATASVGSLEDEAHRVVEEVLSLLLVKE
jgi:hypothetical protein